MTLDPAFTDVPPPAVAAAALDRAAALGARHAAVRVERRRSGLALLRDGRPAGVSDEVHTAVGVSVVWEGFRGFAGVAGPSREAAASAAERAVAVARACRAAGGERVEPVGEPVHRDAEWTSGHRVDPFTVPRGEWTEPLAAWSRALLAVPHVAHVHAKLKVADETTYYADLAGTVTLQHRLRIHPQLLAVGMDERTGAVATLRTLGPPTARGLEYLAGEGWDWAGEVAGMPAHLAGKLSARPVEPGLYDLVVDPSNLWLTIHETVGHATELDRALGHEAGYAGTTFATPDRLGRLRYGSELMNVIADRTTPHALATTGFDHEGVAATSWNLVTEGVLTGFQTDRATARAVGADRSTGCAYAESGLRAPLARMPNVSLRPAPDGPSTEELVAGVSRGLLVVGSDGWTIDGRRRNFRFTAQRCHLIQNGRLAGQVRDAAYQGETTEFWRSLRALGGRADYRVFGADLCGKGQPVQASAASHGAPPAVFAGIEVVNTAREAGA
ncbi:TldD/PmbA family protein [Spirillospora sp. NPDC052269]